MRAEKAAGITASCSDTAALITCAYSHRNSSYRLRKHNFQPGGKNAGLKADLTQEQLYTLSELSNDVIGRIDEKLVIYSFADDNSQSTIVEKTLERYTAANNQIEVKVVDPATIPPCCANSAPAAQPFRTAP